MENMRHRRQLAKSCVLDKSTVIYKTTLITNNLGVQSSIQIGAFSHIRGELLTMGHGGKITIGKYCYVGEDTRIWSGANVEIGDHVLISHNVNIFDNATHPISPRARREQFKAIITTGHPRDIDLQDKPITIANDVLIGCMAVVLAGVQIGEAAIVGAGSVVTADVPPWTIVAGNPARVIRSIPQDER
jgi:acetyltransferase-like isoleucine patch superfamily enzyme